MNKNSYTDMDKDTSDEKSRIINEIFEEWEGLVSEIISYHSKTLKAEHIKLPSFFIMNYLYRNGPQNLSVLAGIMGVSKPTITNIVDHLEREDLVVRTKDNADRRKLSVDLTSRACDKINRIYFSREEVKSELVASLSSSELSRFRDSICALGKIVSQVSSKKLKNQAEGE